jgi:VWFA-related protein
MQFLKVFFSLTILAGSFAVAIAQKPSSKPTDSPESIDVIKVEANLVSVPVIVSDRMGRYVPNLKVENFKLFDGGQEQSITFFDAAEEPLNVAILLDTSLSTEHVLGKIKSAAKSFIKQLRPQDKAMIVSFDYAVHHLSRCEAKQTPHADTQPSTQTPGVKIGCVNPSIGLTNDHKALEKAIDQAEVGRMVGSALNDAVMRVANKDLKDLKGRKAIILLSDGLDQNSNTSIDALLDAETESDTMVYSIFYAPTMSPQLLAGLRFPQGIFSRRRQNDPSKDPKQDGQRQPTPAEVGAAFLNELSEVTSGRFFKSESSNLKETFNVIAEELRNQYRLGFSPGEFKKDGSLHKLQVKVDLPDVAVRARKQYRAAK